MGEPCEHLATQGRKGEGGSWCADCGIKVWAVHDRPCGECRHFALDIGANVMGTCGPKLMTVTSSMRVTYAVDPTPDRAGLCFDPPPHGTPREQESDGRSDESLTVARKP